MTAKRYRVHGTFIDDYSHTQTTVEMVMASDYDSLQAELDGPSGPTQLQQDKAEIARLRDVLLRLMTNPAIDLGDQIYTVREREGLGWDGPAVKAWSDAVSDAKKLIS